MDAIETVLIDGFTNIFFFLPPNHQSLMVSIIHYVLFIIGFYYFLFHTRPGDSFRLYFTGLVVSGALLYFATNRCILTSVERAISKEKNIVQRTIDYFFGERSDGNISSKIMLASSSIFLSGILLMDYGYFKIK